MRYTVTWLPGAINELAQIWTEAVDNQAVTNAANAIDAYLATDAHEKGTVLAEDLRSLQIGTLRILFTVREPDRIVEVATVQSQPDTPKTSNANGDGQAKT